MVVTSGRSNRHVASIADSAIEGLAKAGVQRHPRRRQAERRLGADRRRRRHRPRVPAGGARLLRSRKDVGGQRGAQPPAKPIAGDHEARGRRHRPPEGRPGAGARRALPQARRADRPAHRLSRHRKSWKSAKAAPRRSASAWSRNRSRWPTSSPTRRSSVILDERGESLDSATLASRLGRWRDDGRPAAVFVIGGDDGLAPSLRDKASVRLAFGAATWPHQLVRGHAAGADLSRRHHPVRPSIPPRADAH